MFETTASTGARRAAAVRTPVTAPRSIRRPVTSSPVPQLAAQLGREPHAEPSTTARVPPIGYQTPSAVCMWAIEHSTAGEP